MKKILLLLLLFIAFKASAQVQLRANVQPDSVGFLIPGQKAYSYFYSSKWIRAHFGNGNSDTSFFNHDVTGNGTSLSPLRLSTDTIGTGKFLVRNTLGYLRNDTTIYGPLWKVNTKQATLISGTNIKTINGNSLLGSGNILLQTPLVAGTDYLAPNGSASALTGLLSAQVTGALGFTPENIANKATDFSVLNNFIYPSVQAVATYVGTYYLPLSGGTLSGDLNLGANNILANHVYLTTGYISVKQGGSSNAISMNSIGGRSFFNFADTTGGNYQLSFDNGTHELSFGDYPFLKRILTTDDLGATGPAGGELAGTYPNPTLSNAAVIGKVLTGYSSAAGTVAATDNILQAFQKINGNEVVDAANIATNTSNIATNTTAIAGKQAALSGTGFVKIAGSTISYDNSTYIPALFSSGTYSAAQSINNTAAIIVSNSLSGTAAGASQRASNDGGYSVENHIYNSGFTTVGIIAPNVATSNTNAPYYYVGNQNVNGIVGIFTGGTNAANLALRIDSLQRSTFYNIASYRTDVSGLFTGLSLINESFADGRYGSLSTQTSNSSAITTLQGQHTSDYTAIGLKQPRIILGDPGASSATIAVGDSVNMGLWKLQKEANTSTTGIATNTTSLANVKKRLGAVFSNSLTASTGYVQTGAATTWAFTGSGLTTSGGANDNQNYQSYTSYYTDANYYSEVINVKPTAFGNGVGIGISSPNGLIIGRVTLTSSGNAQLLIDVLRTGTTTNMVTGATTLAFSLNDNLVLTFNRSGTYYYLQLQDVTTGGVVIASVTDPETYAAVQYAWAAGNPAIFHYGGSQTISLHQHSINNFVQNEVLIYGNSIWAGQYSGGAQSMAATQLNKVIPGGVNLIAGGGNLTQYYLLLKPEIFSLKPRIVVFTDGINDIVGGLSSASIEANITTFINDCIANNAIPVVCTVLPIGATYGGGSHSTYVTGITTLNTWINALTNAVVIDTYTAMVSSGNLNAAYDSGDQLHPNAAGQGQLAATVATGLLNITNVANNVLNGTSTRIPYETTNGAFKDDASLTYDASTGLLTTNKITAPTFVGSNGSTGITFQSGSSALASNLYVTASTSNTIGATAALNFAGASSVHYRMFSLGGTQLMNAGNSAADWIMGTETVSTPSSGTTALLAKLVLKPNTVSSGGATVTNTAVLDIEGPMSATVTGKNYSIWAHGMSRLDSLATNITGLMKGNGNGSPATAAVIGTDYIANQASNDITAQTTAGNITTFTVGAATATFNISGYINITAVSTDVIELQCTYTDENSTSQTANFFTQGATSALLSSTGNSAYPTMTIRAKNATVITVKTTLTTGGGSITFDAGARITQL